ncbi:TetR/AcrR family transcriptional regulator [Streptomyces sp. NPDC093089]|uniref:TetR/AcrR family transcriptional regulator n=1 Tax=Streptomyces sp. NPDC093089 TaxID=3366024 RepID=UPI0038062D08
MGETGGLRERKKRQMYARLSDTAIGMFVERGFEEVTVADVAAAVDVSKPTLFRYFPTKEDLVLHRLADHEGEAGRVVAERPDGTSPLEALRNHFLDGLARRDPVTGLNDDDEVLAFHRLVYATPSVVARLHAYVERNEAILAEALGGGTPARLAAGQVVAVQRVLARENWTRITTGDSADALYPEAVAVASAAFGQLGTGVTVLV